MVEGEIATGTLCVLGQRRVRFLPVPHFYHTKTDSD